MFYLGRMNRVERIKLISQYKELRSGVKEDIKNCGVKLLDLYDKFDLSKKQIQARFDDHTKWSVEEIERVYLVLDKIEEMKEAL